MWIDSTWINNPLDQIVGRVWPASDINAVTYLLQRRAHQSAGARASRNGMAACTSKTLNVILCFSGIASRRRNGLYCPLMTA